MVARMSGRTRVTSRLCLDRPAFAPIVVSSRSHWSSAPDSATMRTMRYKVRTSTNAFAAPLEPHQGAGGQAGSKASQTG